MEPTPLRYLSAADVNKAMPAVAERLRLAERTMIALADGAEMPPKIAVHPRPADSFAHAMPALLRGDEAEGSGDLLGMKWVAGFPSNAASGLAAIHGTVILSGALDGVPRAIMDATGVTAHRTAAVSGLAIRHWGPRAGRPATVAIIGAGAQARSHLPVVAHLVPNADIVLCDRDRDRSEALAREVSDAGSGLGQFRSVVVAAEPLSAVAGADLVLTMVSFGPTRQTIPDEAFEPDATIVAIDYDMCVPASVAVRAGLFLVDHREQYLDNRTKAAFTGYPEPMATIGEAILLGTPRPSGRTLVTHLGVGLADVVFADALLREAERLGIGTILAR